MKLHFLTRLLDGPYGGGNQFGKALREALRRRNAYAERPADADVLMLNGYPTGEEHLFRDAVAWKRRRGRGHAVIMRLAGPLALARGGSSRRDDALFAYARLAADGVVMQSRYSLVESEKLGLAPSCPIAVIGNAADPALFFPPGERRFDPARPRLIASSWSGNWKKGFDVYQWLDENLDFDRYSFTFVGNAPVEFRNIRKVDPQPSNKLADLLRRHDIYISASVFESFSNAIVEAIQCGLPVIARNTSSHPEVVRGNGLYFERPEDIPALLEQICGKYEEFRSALETATIDEVADRYVEFCGTVLARTETSGIPAKIPSRAAVRQFMQMHTDLPSGARQGLVWCKGRVKSLLETVGRGHVRSS